MKRVLKFVMTGPTANIDMPNSARVVAAGYQASVGGEGRIVLWALCDETDGLGVIRRFRAVNTGEYFDNDGLAYVATVRAPGVLRSEIVWHVFEVPAF